MLHTSRAATRSEFSVKKSASWKLLLPCRQLAAGPPAYIAITGRTWLLRDEPVVLTAMLPSHKRISG